MVNNNAEDALLHFITLILFHFICKKIIVPATWHPTNKRFAAAAQSFVSDSLVFNQIDVLYLLKMRAVCLIAPGK